MYGGRGTKDVYKRGKQNNGFLKILEGIWCYLYGCNENYEKVNKLKVKILIVGPPKFAQT